MRPNRAALPFVLLLAGGCVTYTPVELSTVSPGEEVRVRVTNEGAVQLARRLGRLTDAVSASVQPEGADSVAVTIWLGKNFPGTEFENVRETAILPRDEILALERRELSKWRSAAAGAAALGVALWLADQITQIGDPNAPDDGGGDPPPGPNDIRIPFRWVF